MAGAIKSRARLRNEWNIFKKDNTKRDEVSCFESVMLGTPFKFLIRCARGTFQVRNYSDDSKGMRIGFIGLGNMGSRMAINLLNKGFNVIASDCNPSNSKTFEASGGKTYSNANDMVSQVDCVISMLPASPQVLSLYTGENGIAKCIRPNTLVIDCSTVDHTTSVFLSGQLKEKGVKFIDAPVSGGIMAAEKATLTFIVGGDVQVVEKAKPLLASMGTRIIHCGDVGTGQLVKMCNNLLLGISMLAVSEVMDLGVRLGLEPKLMASVFNSSSGRCWSSDTYNPVPGVLDDVPSSRDYKAGFTSLMLLKDLKIAQNAANGIGTKLLLGEETLKVYQSICDSNSGEKDFSVVYKYLKNRK